jgi:hypothetical protein
VLFGLQPQLLPVVYPGCGARFRLRPLDVCSTPARDQRRQKRFQKGEAAAAQARGEGENGAATDGSYRYGLGVVVGGGASSFA